MAGINQLSDIYKKKGKEFIDKLFNQLVTVSEKLDGSSFSFEKNLTDDEICYYKRDKDNPISRVDRILMSYYEKPIAYISSLPKQTLNQIPNGWRFGMEYFCNSNPVNIAYDREPKNGLVLTHIIVKDQIGEVERTIVEKIELDYWADILGIEKSPILFQGLLNEDQKIRIMEYLSISYMEILKKYKTDSFVRFIISILNPDLEKSALNDSLDSPIEAIVFRFGDLNGTGENYVAKIVDPVFLEIARERRSLNTSQFPNDIYSLALIDVMNFILERGIDSFNSEGADPEHRYINFIFDVFLRFLEQNESKYKGVDFNEPEYFKKEEFKINKDLIPNIEVKEKVDLDESFETLLQILLSAFRKLKKKPQGFFTEGVIEQFNLLIGEIADHINRIGAVQESKGIPTFGEFRKTSAIFSILDESDDKEDSSDDAEIIDPETDEKPNEFFAYSDFKKVIKTNKEKRKLGKINEDDEDVNLIVGKFQPFNNGHLKMALKAKKENGKNSILCAYHSEKSISKFPMSTQLVEKLLASVKEEYPDLIRDFYFIKSNYLEEAFNKLPNGYYPMTICVGEDGYSNYHLQKDWIKSNGNLINEELKLYKTPQWVKSKDVREFLKNEDFKAFKKSVPKSISLLYNELVSEMKGSQDI